MYQLGGKVSLFGIPKTCTQHWALVKQNTIGSIDEHPTSTLSNSPTQESIKGVAFPVAVIYFNHIQIVDQELRN
ncbi:hypothetical protein Pan241w_37810 [Gimesia alba]|uniref:Uncharacterized protein n=1 Tax=Gimesia alba TaxID=2527973 RepID=A0A517RII5_9PLAN|nr:hypothetical protein Pan241w_37810 [Gimesia alba]